MLMLADRRFYSSTPGGIIGTQVVVAGQQYRVEVADGREADGRELFPTCKFMVDRSQLTALGKARGVR